MGQGVGSGVFVGQCVGGGVVGQCVGGGDVGQGVGCDVG